MLVAPSSGSPSRIAVPSTGSISYLPINMSVGVNGPYWQINDTTWFERDLPLLQECGIEHMRVGIGISQRHVDRCLDAGISVVATLGTTGLPDDLETFRQYVYNHVSEYRGRVEGWIVLNEVNLFYKDITKARYLEVLKVADAAIKQADPNALTLTSNFAYADRATEWMQELYRLDPNVNDYYDIVTLDPYCYRVETGTPSPPEYPYTDMFGHGYWELEGLKQFLDSKGDHSPIWIMEIGWPVADDMSAVDEATQADYLRRALEMAKNWGWIERLYIYKWMDSPTEHSMGLLRNTSPYERPSFYTVKEFMATTKS